MLRYACAQSAVPRSLSWLPVEIDSSGAKVKFKLERPFISHNSNSRVEHLIQPELVLCLTWKEEWRGFSLLQTTSRDGSDMVHTVLCSALPVQSSCSIAVQIDQSMHASHSVVTSSTLISPDLRVCYGLNSNRTSCSTAAAVAQAKCLGLSGH
jgi:hypothetical protein